MAISGIILIVGIFLLLIWMMLGFRRARHKFFSHFLIILLIFVAFTFTLSIRGHEVDLKTASGVLNAGKIYMSWLGSAFSNFKAVTSYAVKMDWGGDNNSTSGG
jgi:uncharacterized membrane protein YhaH (DUF805 family)